MRTNSEIRAAGRFDLSGRWLEAAMLTFVYFIIATIFSATFVGAVNLWIPGMGSAFTLLLIPLAWSFTMTFLANHRHEDRDPFDNVLLWSLLLIIPVIIKALSYSMTPYILRDRPDLQNNAAIELSMDMMQGHKADLFWLYLSFIGWAILCCLTLGIGFFWLDPYMSASVAAFYEDLKADYESQYGGAEEPVYGTTDNYQK